jgi:GNAT superfamily N-acetyltransferase
VAVRTFLSRLSPNTVRARYLSSWTSLAGPLGDGEAQRLVDRSQARHVVVLAFDADEIRGIGEFVETAGSAAELALVVEDAAQRRGIGRSLFQRLRRLAHRRGIRAFTGDVRYSNTPALQFLRATGTPLRTTLGYSALEFCLLLEP